MHTSSLLDSSANSKSSLSAVAYTM